MALLKKTNSFIKQSLASDLYTVAIGLAAGIPSQSNTFVAHALKLVNNIDDVNSEIIHLLHTYRYPEEDFARHKLADKFLTWSNIMYLNTQ